MAVPVTHSSNTREHFKTVSPGCKIMLQCVRTHTHIDRQGVYVTAAASQDTSLEKKWGEKIRKGEGSKEGKKEGIVVERRTEVKKRMEGNKRRRDGRNDV